MREAEFPGDLDIRYPGCLFLFFYFFPVQFADRVAAPDLQVMAEIEDRIAIGLDHLFRHTDLAAFEAPCHASSPSAAIRVS